MSAVSLLDVAGLAGDRVTPFDGQRPFAATGNVDADGRVTAELVTYDDRPSRADLVARPGDVCFARMAGTDKTLLIDASNSALILSTGFAILRPRGGRLDSRYLRHWLRTRPFQAQKDRLCTGATQRAITNEKIAVLRIPLHSLEEQRRIADVLDKAETLRLRPSALVASLVRAVFRQVTTVAVMRTVGDLLEGGELVVHKDGNHGSLYPRSTDFAADGVPFITAKAVREDGSLNVDAVDYLSPRKASQLRIGWIESGDVLLSHNASVGKVCAYDGTLGRALIGTSLTCFRVDPSRSSPAYLAACLRDPDFQRQLARNMAQTTRNQVPITAQRSLTVPWVPLEQQLRFGDFSSRAEILEAHSRRRAQMVDELFASLQSRAFSGAL